MTSTQLVHDLFGEIGRHWSARALGLTCKRFAGLLDINRYIIERTEVDEWGNTVTMSILPDGRLHGESVIVRRGRESIRRFTSHLGLTMCMSTHQTLERCAPYARRSIYQGHSYIWQLGTLLIYSSGSSSNYSGSYTEIAECALEDCNAEIAKYALDRPHGDLTSLPVTAYSPCFEPYRLIETARRANASFCGSTGDIASKIDPTAQYVTMTSTQLVHDLFCEIGRHWPARALGLTCKRLGILLDINRYVIERTEVDEWGSVVIARRLPDGRLHGDSTVAYNMYNDRIIRRIVSCLGVSTACFSVNRTTDPSAPYALLRIYQGHEYAWQYGLLLTRSGHPNSAYAYTEITECALTDCDAHIAKYALDRPHGDLTSLNVAQYSPCFRMSGLIETI